MDRRKEWEPFYRAVLEHVTSRVDALLADFGQALKSWLEQILNNPIHPNWRDQIMRFRQDCFFQGIIIRPESLAAIDELIESRIHGTGRFAGRGPARRATNQWEPDRRFVQNPFPNPSPPADSLSPKLEPSGQRRTFDVSPKAAKVLAGIEQERLDKHLATLEAHQHRRNRERERQLFIEKMKLAKRRPAASTPGEDRFNQYLASSQSHLGDIKNLLEILGRQLDAAKPGEEVDVSRIADQVQVQIYLFHKALENARSLWLRNDLSDDAYARLSEIADPSQFGLPRFISDEQERRFRQQESHINTRLRQRIGLLDNVATGMKGVEIAGDVAALLSGALAIKVIVKQGGKWAAVKLLATTAATFTAEQLGQEGLRAAGASDETITGVRLAAVIVTYILLRRAGRVPNTARPTTPKPVANPVYTAEVEATAEDRLAQARKLGPEGEVAASIEKNTTRIDSLSGAKTYRIPDELTRETLVEVKNVARLSFTAQIRDSLHYSMMIDREFILYIRPNTILSKPLKRAIDAGYITAKYLP